MALDIVVGRHGNQPFPISQDHNNVSGEHVLIHIDDYNNWSLQDLNSTNGVFVQNAEGDYERVFQARINADSVIRLGGSSHRCYTFQARRVIQQPDDFAPQFDWLMSTRDEMRVAEDAVEKKMKKAQKLQKFSGLIALGLVGLSMLAGVGGESAMMLRFGFMGVAPLLPELIFGTPADMLKAVRAKKQKLLRCPKCGAPLSDHDVDMMICPRCKAR